MNLLKPSTIILDVEEKSQNLIFMFFDGFWTIHLLILSTDRNDFNRDAFVDQHQIDKKCFSIFKSLFLAINVQDDSIFPW